MRRLGSQEIVRLFEGADGLLPLLEKATEAAVGNADGFSRLLEQQHGVREGEELLIGPTLACRLAPRLVERSIGGGGGGGGACVVQHFNRDVVYTPHEWATTAGRSDGTSRRLAQLIASVSSLAPLAVACAGSMRVRCEEMRALIARLGASERLYHWSIHPFAEGLAPPLCSARSLSLSPALLSPRCAASQLFP